MLSSVLQQQSGGRSCDEAAAWVQIHRLISDCPEQEDLCTADAAPQDDEAESGIEGFVTAFDSNASPDEIFGSFDLEEIEIANACLQEPESAAQSTFRAPSTYIMPSETPKARESQESGARRGLITFADVSLRRTRRVPRFHSLPTEGSPHSSERSPSRLSRHSSLSSRSLSRQSRSSSRTSVASPRRFPSSRSLSSNDEDTDQQALHQESPEFAPGSADFRPPPWVWSELRYPGTFTGDSSIAGGLMGPDSFDPWPLQVNFGPPSAPEDDGKRLARLDSPSSMTQMPPSPPVPIFPRSPACPQPEDCAFPHATGTFADELPLPWTSPADPADFDSDSLVMDQASSLLTAGSPSRDPTLERASHGGKRPLVARPTTEESPGTGASDPAESAPNEESATQAETEATLVILESVSKNMSANLRGERDWEGARRHIEVNCTVDRVLADRRIGKGFKNSVKNLLHERRRRKQLEFWRNLRREQPSMRAMLRRDLFCDPHKFSDSFVEAMADYLYQQRTKAAPGSVLQWPEAAHAAFLNLALHHHRTTYKLRFHALHMDFFSKLLPPGEVEMAILSKCNCSDCVSAWALDECPTRGSDPKALRLHWTRQKARLLHDILMAHLNLQSDMYSVLQDSNPKLAGWSKDDIDALLFQVHTQGKCNICKRSKRFCRRSSSDEDDEDDDTDDEDEESEDENEVDDGEESEDEDDECEQEEDEEADPDCRRSS